MVAAFVDFIQANHLLQQTDRILVAVSGGIDSVVLCALLREAKITFGIAHCNFQLRGEDSAKDQLFVQKIAQQYQVAFHTINFDTNEYVTTHKVSVQMAARELRYEWLENIRTDNNYTFIATAHHQNDVVETMLYNLTKGTGIAGLHGILPKSNKLIRPLLFVDKVGIKDFALQINLQWREDKSNDSIKYTRNKLRHTVIPILQEINPSLTKTFSANAQRFREVEIIYQQGIKAYKKKLLEADKHKHEVLISIQKLKNIEPLSTVLYEVLKDFNFTTAQTGQIITALDSESGKLFYSATHQIIKDRKFLIISKKTNKQTDFSIIFEEQKTLEKSDLTFTFSQHTNEDFTIPTINTIACFDKDKVQFPLLLRRWKKGDYFYPFGMNRKKKKVSRFFIDQKFSLKDKEEAWILTDKGNRIIWIVGHRTDERFKLTKRTKQIYQITIT